MKILESTTIAVILVGLIFSSSAKADILYLYSFESEALEDASGNNNVAEIRGDAERVIGKIGMGLRLDGVDDLIFAADEGVL